MATPIGDHTHSGAHKGEEGGGERRERREGRGGEEGGERRDGEREEGRGEIANPFKPHDATKEREVTTPIHTA